MTSLGDIEQPRDALAKVASDWWTPDPRIVSKLPKGGNKDKATWQSCSVCGGWHARNAIHLDYVGHADLTRTLIEIDPLWSWEPFALDGEGLPLVVQRVNQFVMWGRVTILGKTLPCVGTCDLGKNDADKELVGDLLRNAAMRFGIYGALWSKVDGWEDESHNETGPALVAPPEAASKVAPVDPNVLAAASPPEKPLRDMTAGEMARYGDSIGVRVSGNKTEILRQLEPYVMAATGAEPFEVDGVPPIKELPVDARRATADVEGTLPPFEPVVADPPPEPWNAPPISPGPVKNRYKETPGSIRAGLKSTERTR